MEVVRGVVKRRVFGGHGVPADLRVKREPLWSRQCYAQMCPHIVLAQDGKRKRYWGAVTVTVAVAVSGVRSFNAEEIKGEERGRMPVGL